MWLLLCPRRTNGVSTLFLRLNLSPILIAKCSFRASLLLISDEFKRDKATENHRNRLDLHLESQREKSLYSVWRLWADPKPKACSIDVHQSHRFKLLTLCLKRLTQIYCDKLFSLRTVLKRVLWTKIYPTKEFLRGSLCRHRRKEKKMCSEHRYDQIRKGHSSKGSHRQGYTCSQRVDDPLWISKESLWKTVSFSLSTEIWGIKQSLCKNLRLRLF